MKINDWEDCTPKFLVTAFDEDSYAIVNYLGVNKIKTVMEVGFGNNRLLPKILKLDHVKYYGFDKTKSFVERARENFDSDRVEFDLLDLEDLDAISDAVDRVNPETLILRYVLDHIPNWQRVLAHIDTLGIPSLLLCTFTKPVRKSYTHMQLGGYGKIKYTLNFFSNPELNSILKSYNLVEIILNAVFV